MDFCKNKEMQLEQMLPLLEEQLALGKTVRFYPRGVSMLPLIRENIDSVMLASAPPTLQKYDLPLYRRTDGQFILHRIVGVEEDTYVCRGDNQLQPEPGVRHEQVVALVIGFYRGERYHSITEWRYRLYCRCHTALQSLRRFMRRAAGWLRRHLCGRTGT